MLAIASSAILYKAQAQNAPTPVFAAQVQNIAYSDQIEALGSLQANENVNITSTVTERIISVNFDDNQQVKKGDLLALMDSAQEEAELAEEQSRLDEAKRQINRLRPLVKDGVASDSALDEQDREVNTATARIKAIQSRINERRITAPFDGVVGIRNISAGALVQPGTLITTIDDISVMKLDFSIPEIHLASLQRGIKIRATTSAYPNKVFSGEVSSIDSRVDVVTRAVLARALIDNSEGLLKAGMLMQIELQKNLRSALVIPEEAIIARSDSNYVFLIDDINAKAPKVTQQAVQIGTRREGEVEVLTGLDEGDYVVSHGTVRLRDNAQIAVRAIEDKNQSLAELLEQNFEPSQSEGPSA